MTDIYVETKKCAPFDIYNTLVFPAAFVAGIIGVNFNQYIPFYIVTLFFSLGTLWNELRFHSVFNSFSTRRKAWGFVLYLLVIPVANVFSWKFNSGYLGWSVTFLFYDLLILDAMSLHLLHRREFDQGLQIFWWILFASAIYAIIEYFVRDNILDYIFPYNYHTVGEGHRSTSFYANSQLGASLYLLGFWIPCRNTTKKKRTISRIIFALAMICAMQRGAWLSLLLSLILYAILFFSNRNTQVVSQPEHEKKETSGITRTVLIICLSCIGVALLWITGLGSNIVSRTFTSYSAHIRWTYWKYALNHMLHDRNPLVILFGHGVAASYYLIDKTNVRIDVWRAFDNSYLSYWYNDGLIIFIGILICLIRILQRIINTGKRNLHCAEFLTAMGLFTILMSFTFYDIYSYLYLNVMLAFLGTAVLLDDHIRDDHRDTV